MARPDKKHERAEQIMLAFERCVARFGVEGATLERVAAEAGLARALIRHNVGNREDLIAALVERFFDRSDAQWRAFEESLPANLSARGFVERLFDPAYNDPHEVLLTEALIAYGAQDKALAERLSGWLDQSLAVMERVVRTLCPDAAADRVEAAAAGVMGIYFNVDSFAFAADNMRLRNASKRAAMMLIEGLYERKTP